MDFELPEEHQLAYESAFAFARDEIRPHNAEIERSDDFPRWMWKKLAEQGYTGVAIPEEYGGSGGDFLMAALVSRGIGRANGAIAMSFGAHLKPCATEYHSLGGSSNGCRTFRGLQDRLSCRRTHIFQAF
jgi:isovaleryl-CoA dehydrogenase